MRLKENIQAELSYLVTFKQTNKKWHLSLLATLSVGIPLLAGLYLGNLKFGLAASICGMVILYLPNSGSITNRILTLLVCSFGFMVSYAFGLFFSFNAIIATIALGVFAFIVHWIILHYKSAPPGSMFFILMASLSICQPFNLETIPTKVGLIGLGTIFSCLLALIYIFSISLQSTTKVSTHVIPAFKKNASADFWEAIIMGLFIFIALAVGKLLQFDNPYWIPISSAAVMQGASLYNIWQRTFHRILGTFIGLGLCWAILHVVKTPLSICITIIMLQFIVQMLVVRQYAVAVIFITPMTILLTEAANPLIHTPNALIGLRFWEIAIGSILGAIGGWVIHKEKIRYASIRSIRKLRVGIKKKL